jgi:hypothetical protein
MRFLIEVEENAPAAQIARATRDVLEALIRINLPLVVHGRVPPLYDSGVSYVPPSTDAQENQRLLTAAEVYARRSGTCGDLTAWRSAELRARGDRRIGCAPCLIRPDLTCAAHPPIRNENGELITGCPAPKIYWRDPQGGTFHAEVRLPTGDTEDPSRFLGMPSGAQTG